MLKYEPLWKIIKKKSKFLFCRVSTLPFPKKYGIFKSFSSHYPFHFTVSKKRRILSLLRPFNAIRNEKSSL